jgi:hypothetical protein
VAIRLVVTGGRREGGREKRGMKGGRMEVEMEMEMDECLVNVCD